MIRIRAGRGRGDIKQIMVRNAFSIAENEFQNLIDQGYEDIAMFDGANNVIMEYHRSKDTIADKIRKANIDEMATIIAAKLVQLARKEYGVCDVVDKASVLEWLQQEA